MRVFYNICAGAGIVFLAAGQNTGGNLWRTFVLTLVGAVVFLFGLDGRDGTK